MTRRFAFRFRGGRVAAVLGALLAAGVLACVVLLFLGLWIVFAVAFVGVTLVAIVRALVWRRPREPSIEANYAVVDESLPQVRKDAP